MKHAADFPDARAEQVVLKGFPEPVTAYRLHGDGAKPLVSDPEETSAKHRTSLGAIIFGILGAPCAIATLIGPLAVILGVGWLFGLAGALTFLDQSLSHPHSCSRIGCTRKPLSSPSARALRLASKFRPSKP